VVFIDEVDAIGVSRFGRFVIHGAAGDVLLTEMDGIASGNENSWCSPPPTPPGG